MRAKLIGLALLQRVLACAHPKQIAFNLGVYVDALLAMLMHAEKDEELRRVCVLLSRLLLAAQASPASTEVNDMIRRLLAEMARPHRATQRTLLLDVLRVRLRLQHLNAVQFLPTLMPVLAENARWADPLLSCAVISMLEVVVAQLWLRLPHYLDTLLCILAYTHIECKALSARCTHLVVLLRSCARRLNCMERFEITCEAILRQLTARDQVSVRELLSAE